MKKFKDLSRTAILARITVVLIVCTVFALMGTTVLRIESNSTAIQRYELAFRANQFMNASAYLTSEARAYAATGNVLNYDNYWNEVNIVKNRNIGVSSLKELGVTAEEEAVIDRMAFLSDELVPVEAYAMDLASAGDYQGALDVVYGDYYVSTVNEIRALREELRSMLDERTSNSLSTYTWESEVIGILSWLLVAGVVVVQILQKKTLFRLAYTDPLSGEANYLDFRERMRDDIEIHGKGYIVSADLKGFSIINDVCGVERGDEILCEVAKVLHRCAGKHELFAHAGGDHFVLFLQCRDDDELIRRLTAAREEILGLSEHMDIPYMMPMFGICQVEDSLKPERGYGDANLAKRELKLNSAEGFYAFFDQEMQQKLLENHQIEDDFDYALRNREFEMWYQPKYSVKDGSLSGAEALVRWRKPNNTLVFPGTFIPLFERNGMIARLDRFAFEEVCARQRAWMDAGRKLVPISVNISRATVLQVNVVEQYAEILKRYQIPASCIELELTETAMSGNSSMEEILVQFRECGLCILVDDFGTGYSSLATLTNDYFNGIKLDKSLVDRLNTPAGRYLLETITALAHKFNMNVTAEGVEHAYQVEVLKPLSCDLIQGFFYSKPLHERDFSAMLEKSA